MIYASGSYDNTVSSTNPNPVTVQSGLNTEDEMFIFLFQFLAYQMGDENISIENGAVSTNTFGGIVDFSVKELLETTNIIGQRIRPKNNIPLFYIYDDGTVEKKIIIE